MKLPLAWPRFLRTLIWFAGALGVGLLAAFCATYNVEHLSPVTRQPHIPYFQYAAGFSEKAFSRVRVGMNRDEVLTLLGEPLMRLSRSTVWRYAHSGGSFSLRDISFSPDGKVSEINKDFYLD